jgi:hypothetical protein
MMQELHDIIDETLFISRFIIYENKKETKHHRKVLEKLKEKIERGKDISEYLENDSDE